MSKTEVQLVCSSCQEEFVRYLAPKVPEEKWTEIQKMLKEKEPKCEKCASNVISWEGLFQETPKYTYELDGKKIPLIASDKVPKDEVWFVKIKPNDLSDEIAAQWLVKALKVYFGENSALYNYLISKDSGEKDEI